MADEKTIIADSFSATIFAPQQRTKACLVQYSGSNIGKRFLLDQEIMMAGRATHVPIQINDASVSRQHAKFLVRDSQVDVEDLNTTNGTFVNEKRISQILPLRDGDMIRLGTVLLKFFAHGNIENVFHDKIYRMATIDATTQIFNKKYLLETLENEFRASASYGKPLSLIMYDLDFFKQVNDQHGHNAGDMILRETAQIAKSVIRKSDTIGRFGGEEFGIILPDTDIKTAYDMAERVRKAIETQAFPVGPKSVRQTISSGVAHYTKDLKSPQALIEIADQKLYQSKRTGRNKVTV